MTEGARAAGRLLEKNDGAAAMVTSVRNIWLTETAKVTDRTPLVQFEGGCPPSILLLKSYRLSQPWRSEVPMSREVMFCGETG